MSRRPLAVFAAAGALALMACGVNDPSSSIGIADASENDVFEHDFFIPVGTADRIDAGEDVEIVPREMEVTVGESIRIVNDDDEGHTVGVFFVGAGETLTKEFVSAGVLEGECSVHSSGQFTLRVVEG